MPRQLVVCLDGTNNRFSHRPTNIVRLRRSLADGVVAYYDQGVGTFGLKETLFEWQKVPARVSGLMFGWGMKRVIEGAFRFIAENHTNDEDEIFLFGFSRGAYAVRVLAALIHAVGLLAPHETHLFDYAWGILLARDRSSAKPDFELHRQFKATFGKPVRIHLLGLFDTVKSFGWLYDPVVIPYTANNTSVVAVRHAISIDEYRCFFRQHLWGGDPSRTDVKEVWFAGVHSDIGGGYLPEEAHLALVAHRWMLGEAYDLGLALDLAACERSLEIDNTPAAEFPLAAAHNELAGPWLAAEWLPRRVWLGGAKRSWDIGTMPPFFPPRPRPIAEGSLFHRSVEQRLAGRADYQPPNLPTKRTWVEDLLLPPSIT